MSHSTPQSDNFADFFRRKNLTVVPKEQDELLQEPDAWAVDLKKTHYGLVNVPSHVLDAVKNSYLASRHGQGQSQPDEQAVAKGPGQDATPKSPITSAPGSPTGSSPERALSAWSSSPERRSPRRPAMSAQSVVHETPNAPPPFSRHGERLQVATVYEPPSSNEVDELETHVPEGEGNTTRLGRSPMRTQDVEESSEDEESESEDDEEMTTTPPCAQPDEQIIPGTVTVESTEAAAAALNQRRRMKPITFSDGSPVKQPTHNFAVPPRMQPLRQFDIMETQESSIPSSIIPATAREPLTQASVAEKEKSVAQILKARQEESTLAEVNEGEESELDEPHAMLQDSEAVVIDSISPIELFEEAYPDYQAAYNGNLNKFIKACVCLEYLQRERALRECLYDEFIRSFSSGYLNYVGKARAGQEPLPAIEWFNMQRGPSIYGKLVMTRETLQRVLELHHAEVSKVRSLILGASEADETRIDDETPTNDLSTSTDSEPMEVDEPESATQAPLPPSQTPQPASAFKHDTQVPQQSSTPLVATPILRTPKSERIAKPSAKARQQISPQLGSGSPVSAAQAAPLASQYMEQLASRRKSSNPAAEAERRVKLLEFLRKRSSGGVRSSSSSSRAGSLAR